MNFEQVLPDFRQNGNIITRRYWGPGFFVFRQIPNEIGLDVIPKMQSVPDEAKNEMIKRDQSLSYEYQAVIVDPHGCVDSWCPTVNDLLANDWEFYTNGE